MFYRKQIPNFRDSEFPMSASAVPFIFQNRFTSFNSGELFDFLATTLWSLTGVRTNSIDFSLVNVTCPFNGFSHGSCRAPHLSTRPTGKAAIFTFAITYKQEYDNEIEVDFVMRNQNCVTRWSTQQDSAHADFVSISVNQVQAHLWGLTNLQMYQLMHLYNVIGGLTKSILRHQKSFILEENYEERHAGLNLVDMHDRYFAMPFKRLAESVPIVFWCFNRTVWELAPQILMQRLITPQVALYWFMYLADDQRVMSGKKGTCLYERLGLLSNDDGGVCDMMETSVFNMVSMIGSPHDTDFTSSELLAPIVLSQLLNGIGSKLSGFSREYLSEFAVITRELVALLSLHPEILPRMLPADVTARHLMNVNRSATRNYIKSLQRELGDRNENSDKLGS